MRTIRFSENKPDDFSIPGWLSYCNHNKDKMGQGRCFQCHRPYSTTEKLLETPDLLLIKLEPDNADASPKTFMQRKTMIVIDDEIVVDPLLQKAVKKDVPMDQKKKVKSLPRAQYTLIGSINRKVKGRSWFNHVRTPSRLWRSVEEKAVNGAELRHLLDPEVGRNPATPVLLIYSRTYPQQEDPVDTVPSGPPTSNYAIKSPWVAEKSDGLTSVGIVNGGNECYMIGLIQLLAHAPVIVNWLKNDQTHLHKRGSPCGIAKCIICAIRIYLMNYWVESLRRKSGTTKRFKIADVKTLFMSLEWQRKREKARQQDPVDLWRWVESKIRDQLGG